MRFTRCGLVCACLVVAALGAWCQPLFAAAITADQATLAVKGWLNTSPTPLGIALSPKITSAEGTILYYAGNLDPAGFVVVSASDQVEPIICFSGKGAYARSPACAVSDLVEADLANRMQQCLSRAGAMIRN